MTTTLADQLKHAKQLMDKTVEAVKREFSTVRTGKATTALLDLVRVEAYGNEMPLTQVASVAVSDSRSLTITPWEKQMVSAVEKAILASDLGLTPNTSGTVIRINLPALTEERRKELSRHTHKQAEEGRNVVRQVRRDANERLKKLLKDHTISEDDERKGLEQVQKVTDEHVKMIDELQKKKDQELLEH